MELQHLRCFVAVAEEQHFARAAERLGIEQSPLSRAIKELEVDLGVQLFARTTPSTQLTWPGQRLLEDARGVLTAVDHARHNVLQATSGKKGWLRIGFCDGLAHQRLSRLFARCRREEPDIDLLVLDRPFDLQLKELQAGSLDVGFALASTNNGGLRAEPLWTDPLVAVLTANHVLTRKPCISLTEAIREPLVLCHPECSTGAHIQLPVDD